MSLGKTDAFDAFVADLDPSYRVAQTSRVNRIIAAAKALILEKMKVKWAKLREERGQPFLCLTLDLWSTAKARDSFGCICASFIEESMKVDRAAYVRSVQVRSS